MFGGDDLDPLYFDVSNFLVTPDSGLIKMRSRLGTQFMAFIRLIERILTFRDKKYRILMFRDKTESYLTVWQQNNAEAC